MIMESSLHYIEAQTPRRFAVDSVSNFIGRSLLVGSSHAATIFASARAIAAYARGHFSGVCDAPWVNDDAQSK